MEKFLSSIVTLSMSYQCHDGKISFFNKNVCSKPVQCCTNNAMDIFFLYIMVYPAPVPCCSNDAMEKTVHSKPVQCCTNNAMKKNLSFNRQFILNLCYAVPMLQWKMSFFNKTVYSKPVPCCTNNAIPSLSTTELLTPPFKSLLLVVKE